MSKRELLANAYRAADDLCSAHGNLMAALWRASENDTLLRRLMTHEIDYVGEAHNLPPIPGQFPDFRQFECQEP